MQSVPTQKKHFYTRAHKKNYEKLQCKPNLKMV